MAKGAGRMGTGETELHLPTLVTSLMSHIHWLPSLSSLNSLLSTSVSWGQFPNKLLAHKYYSQCLLLGQPKPDSHWKVTSTTPPKAGGQAIKRRENYPMIWKTDGGG